MRIRLDNTAGQPGGARRDYGNAGESGKHQQVRQVAIQFRVRSEVFVADAQINRQAPAGTPVVPRIPAGGPASKIVIAVAVLQGTGLRQAQQKIGEVEARSTRLNSSHLVISYAVFCLKK